MSGTTEVTIYHLEMRDIEQFRPSRRYDPDFDISQIQLSSPTLSRHLYTAVGGPWHWHERLTWTEQKWLAYLDRPEQETWVGYFKKRTAGYFELERQPRGSVELVYFGLMPDFIGKGLGGLLLSAAVRRSWQMGARRVWVHTCTLDHHHALRNYLSRGFRVFKEERKDVVLPVKASILPPGLNRESLSIQTQESAYD